ncbi:MAG: AsmA family protein [Parvibaculaceae bacterium]|nr:AsmA family protein [Parvibaculaceae bacterium]
MNSLLSYIAGLIVLVLFAALIGPSFVDWNDFRNDIEAELSLYAGRPVSVEGDIHFVFLPAPQFKLNDISIANKEGGHAASLLHVSALEGEVGLTPLLQGKIEVTRIRLRDFQLNLEAMESGADNWDVASAFLSADPDETAFIDPDKVALARVVLENGTVTYRGANDSELLNFLGLQAEVSAGSLRGPFRLSGTFDLENENQRLPVSMSLGLGSDGSGKAFPVTFNASVNGMQGQVLAHRWEAAFNGVATGYGGDALLDGALKVLVTPISGDETDHALVHVSSEGNQVGDAQQAGDTQEVPSQTNQTVRPELELATILVVNNQGVTFEDVRLLAGGASFKGAGTYRPADVRSFFIDLRAPTADVDKLFFAAQTFDEISFLQALTPVSLQGQQEIILKTDGLTYGAYSFDATSVRFMRELGNDVAGWRILGEVSGVGENGTLSVDGVLAEHQSGQIFSGAAHLNTDDLRRVFSVNDVSRLGAAYRRKKIPLYGETQFALGPDLWRLYGLNAWTSKVREGPAHFSGGFSWARRARPSFGVEISANRLNLDLLTALVGAGPQDGAGWRALGEAQDFNVILNAQSVQYDAPNLSADFQDVSLDANWVEGVLTVNKMNFAQTDAGAVELSGVLSDLTQVPLGGVEMRITRMPAATFDHFLALVSSTDTAVGQKPGVASSHAGGGVVNLQVSARGEMDGEFHQAQIDLKGDVEGTKLSAVMKRTGSATDFSSGTVELLLQGANDNGSVLARHIGLRPLRDELAGGEARLQFKGRSGGPYDLSARVSSGAVNGSFSGTLSGANFVDYNWGQVEGRFEMTAANGRLFTETVGIDTPLSRFVLANGGDGGVIAGGRMKVHSNLLEMAHLEVLVGSFRASGDLSIVPEEGGGHQIGGTLEFGRLSLNPLIWPTQSNRDAAQGFGLWSAHPLDWSGLAGISGALVLKPSRLEFADLALSDATLNLTIEDGLITANPVTGTLAGGRMTLAAKIGGGVDASGAAKEATLDLLISTENFSIEEASQALFDKTLGQGRGGLNLSVAGKGRSWLGLVSSLVGTGSVTLEEGVLSGFDIALFNERVGELTSLDGVADLERETLGEGATPFGQIAGTLSVDAGAFSFTPTDLDFPYSEKIALTALGDLSLGRVDVEMIFPVPDAGADATARFVVTGHARETLHHWELLPVQERVAERLLKQEANEAGLRLTQTEIEKLLGRKSIIVGTDGNDAGALDLPIDDEDDLDGEAQSLLDAPGVPIPLRPRREAS